MNRNKQQKLWAVGSKLAAIAALIGNLNNDLALDLQGDGDNKFDPYHGLSLILQDVCYEIHTFMNGG